VHVIASPRKLTHRDLAQRDRRATAAKLNVSTSVARHAGFSGDSEHAANNPTRVMSATGPAWWLTSGHLTAEFEAQHCSSGIARASQLSPLSIRHTESPGNPG
jgi:hypothetical protein